MKKVLACVAACLVGPAALCATTETIPFSLTIASKQGADRTYAIARGEIQYDAESVQISLTLDSRDVRILSGSPMLKAETIGPVRFVRKKSNGADILVGGDQASSRLVFYLDIILPLVEAEVFGTVKAEDRPLVLSKGTNPNEWTVQRSEVSRKVVQAEHSKFRRRIFIHDKRQTLGADIGGSGDLDPIIRLFEERELPELESLIRDTQEQVLSIVIAKVQR